MNSFTIYVEYMDLITLLPKKRDQEELLFAICKYMLYGEEPNLNDDQMKIFKNLKRPLDKSKNKSKLKSKQNQNEIKSKSNENQNNNNFETHQDVDVDVNVYVNNNLFNYIQKELNRTLSSSEIELINTWEDNDITRHAIKETALARATSLKYTERILETYKSKGLKTLAEIERYEKDFREKKSNKKPTWFDKDIKEESASNEEQEELNELLREFK